MIPKTLHFIWLGKLKIPQVIIDSWIRHHKDFKIVIWDNETIKNLKMINQKYFDKSLKYNQKSDIARYEILYQFGGVYVDCDIHCVNNIEKLLDRNFLITFEKKNLLSNSFIGASPGNQLIKSLIDKISKGVDADIAVWKTTGPQMVSNLFCEKISIHYTKSSPVLLR